LALALPAATDYGALPGLSAEVREIFGRVRPATLHAAARTPGVRPSTLLSLF
jgi:tRNA uridine 5-carboxymethylaminomethyl modification enzyme